jgi:hypothetical protein
MIISTRELFRPLHAALIDLLRGLGADDWHKQVGAGEWTVRDVAAHLLDGDLRRISADRDGHVQRPTQQIRNDADLLRHLNGLNAEWTAAARRISTRLLVDLLEHTGDTISSLMGASAVDGEATFAVAWAGLERSPMWLDVGREFTERWHHQDQIREAVHAPPITRPELLGAVIRISLYATPPSLRTVDRPDGTVAAITASGHAGGEWHLLRRSGAWHLADTASAVPDARISATDLDLARLLMHRLSDARVTELVTTEGDHELAAALIRARAVMV